MYWLLSAWASFIVCELHLFQAWCDQKRGNLPVQFSYAIIFFNAYLNVKGFACSSSVCIRRNSAVMSNNAYLKQYFWCPAAQNCVPAGAIILFSSLSICCVCCREWGDKLWTHRFKELHHSGKGLIYWSPSVQVVFEWKLPIL